MFKSDNSKCTLRNNEIKFLLNIVMHERRRDRSIGRDDKGIVELGLKLKNLDDYMVDYKIREFEIDLELCGRRTI